MSEWKHSGRHFPKPIPDENKVYKCRSGDDIFSARFCYGGDEFWWEHPETGKEVRVSEYYDD